MNCPKCQAFMEMKERIWDYDDGETLIGVERYYCAECDETYEREVTYTLTEDGGLV